MHLVLVVLTALLLGCGPRSVQITPRPAGFPSLPSSDYIDLEPGWRLRVITPLLKSGGYRLQVSDEETAGNTLTLSAGDDFVGYETAYYTVRSRKGRGVRVAFASAEATSEGKTVARRRPREKLFQLPRRARFVRLLYLKRVSEADHDMAVVAADEVSVLDEITREVQASPGDACQSNRRRYCSWVPGGIAVRPEMRVQDDTGERWVPAR